MPKPQASRSVQRDPEPNLRTNLVDSTHPVMRSALLFVLWVSRGFRFGTFYRLQEVEVGHRRFQQESPCGRRVWTLFSDVVITRVWTAVAPRSSATACIGGPGSFRKRLKSLGVPFLAFAFLCLLCFKYQSQVLTGLFLQRRGSKVVVELPGRSFVCL